MTVTQNLPAVRAVARPAPAKTRQPVTALPLPTALLTAAGICAPLVAVSVYVDRMAQAQITGGGVLVLFGAGIGAALSRRRE